MFAYKKNIPLTLITIAIFFQSFACMDTYCIKFYATLDIHFYPITLNFISTFLIGWLLFSFVSRVSGAYFFGKFIDQTNFFNAMRLISIIHIFIALLFFAVSITGENFQNKYLYSYLVRFLSASFSFVAMVAPAMYLFKKHLKSEHILVSTCIVLAIFLGKVFAHALVDCEIDTDIDIHVKLLPTVFSILSLIIYNYVKKHSPSDATQTEISDRHKTSLKHKKTLAFIIGAACSTALTYYYFFLNSYLIDIVIVKNHYCIKGQSCFYISFVLFLLPAGKICEKFKPMQIMEISFITLLVLGIASPFAFTSHISHMTSQVLFAFLQHAQLPQA